MRNHNYTKYVNDDGSVKSAFSTASTEDIAAFYDELAAAIRGGTLNVTAISKTSGKASSVTFEGLDLGNYFILVEGGIRVYKPTSVNVIPTCDGATTATCEWNVNDVSANVQRQLMKQLQQTMERQHKKMLEIL